MPKPLPPQAPSCQNCGNPEDIEFFAHTLGGITLCDTCSWLPHKSVYKRTNLPKWIKHGNGWIPDEPIPKCISAKQSEMPNE